MVAQNKATPGRGGAIVTMSRCALACSGATHRTLMHRRTLCSVNAELAIPSIAGYNASKGGVSNLTRCMVRGACCACANAARAALTQLPRIQALALAPHGIRVNAVGPGSIMTDVLASVATDAAARERILSRTPLGRIGTPAEVGEVVAFIASDAASYMTGQVLYVDGGRMALNYTMPVANPNA
jgi:NAD(P)-dependent dehydrogenase (short-subunit alcohol dehydrogenase family)